MKKDFVYLASASSRRRSLLEQIRVPFRVLPAAVCETRQPRESPEEYVLRLARAKADAVWGRLGGEEPGRAVLAADTAVVVGQQVLGKPDDTDTAMQMLAALSGRTHTVLTAVALRCEARALSRLTVSEVRFRATTAQERSAYCATGEPLDKAGGYAIQGCGAVFVEHIEGSYSSVMGLPLAETAEMLRDFGFPEWLQSGGAMA